MLDTLLQNALAVATILTLVALPTGVIAMAVAIIDTVYRRHKRNKAMDDITLYMDKYDNLYADIDGRKVFTGWRYDAETKQVLRGKRWTW